MRIARALIISVLALGTAGCGPELLGGTHRDGEVRTVATSQEGGDASRSSVEQGALADPADGAAQVRGEVSVRARVSLIRDDGTSMLVTGRDSATVRIEGTGESLLGRADVQAGTYAGVRVEFFDVLAIVEGGLIVDGLPLLGPVTVQLGSGGAVVERPIEVVVEARSSRTIVIDLNAHEWLPLATLPSRSVPADQFRSAVEIRLR